MQANRVRDRQVTRAFRKNGWVVLRIWEHELTMQYRHIIVGQIGKALGTKLKAI